MALVNQYKNNAAGKLLAGITAVATSCTLQSGQGSNFPTADGTSTKFLVTLVKSTGEREICVCKRTAGSDVITFIDVTTGNASVNGRAQEGTSALAFSADDQVELRLTAAQITSFEEDIDTLQTTVAAINADYLDSDHLPGGADEDDHDTRYYTQAQLWTQTELSADNALGIDMGNITANRSDLAHSEITDDDAAKHRLIDDGKAAGDADDDITLWSVEQIDTAKADTVHTHDKDFGMIHVSYTGEGVGMGTNAVGTQLYSSSGQGTNGINANNTSFSDTVGLFLPVYLTADYTSYSFVAKVGNRNGPSDNVRLRIKIWTMTDEVEMDSAQGAVIETGPTLTPTTVPDRWTLYESAVNSMTVPTEGWYTVLLQGRVHDATPGRYWALRTFTFMARPTEIS